MKATYDAYEKFERFKHSNQMPLAEYTKNLKNFFIVYKSMR